MQTSEPHMFEAPPISVALLPTCPSRSSHAHHPPFSDTPGLFPPWVPCATYFPGQEGCPVRSLSLLAHQSHILLCRCDGPQACSADHGKRWYVSLSDAAHKTLWEDPLHSPLPHLLAGHRAACRGLGPVGQPVKVEGDRAPASPRAGHLLMWNLCTVFGVNQR